MDDHKVCQARIHKSATFEVRTRSQVDRVHTLTVYLVTSGGNLMWFTQGGLSNGQWKHTALRPALC